MTSHTMCLFTFKYLLLTHNLKPHNPVPHLNQHALLPNLQYTTQQYTGLQS